MKLVNKNNAVINRQSGAALLIAMVVLASMAAFYMLGQFGAVSQKQKHQDNRVEALASAKKALLSHAVTYIDSLDSSGIKRDGRMGFLPCPDNSGAGASIGVLEGIQAGNCEGQNINALGRFPWKSLKVAPQFDESNECLWYAVSGYYKANPPTQMLNEDTNGMFAVYNAAGNLIYGANPEERIVAIVIAPGVPLGQTRSLDADAVRCKGAYTKESYLEGNGDGNTGTINNSVLDGNVDELDTFIKAGTDTNIAAPPFNDLIITITRDEVWNAIKRRHDFIDKMKNLAQEIAVCIQGYGNAGTARNLPWPAPFDLANTDYRQDINYTDVNVGFGSVLGRLPNQINGTELQLSTNPINNNGNGGGNAGQGGGNGGGNAGQGGGNGGGTATSPPTGDQGCIDCWNDYQDELTVTDTDYNTCINNGNPPGQCKNIRKDEYDEALLDYNTCIAGFTCTPGTGTGGSTEKNEEFVLFDPADPVNAGNPLNCLTGGSLSLWQHWKDHFFYVVSEDFSPSSTNVTCSGNCVTTMSGNQHAGIVIFSGSRSAGQTRNAPIIAGDPDDKSIVTNYLSSENDGSNTVYDYVPGAITNPTADADILVCIDEGPNVADPLVVTPGCL